MPRIASITYVRTVSQKLFFLSTLLSLPLLHAEQGILVLYVTDTQGVPLTGVQLTVKGDGGAGRTEKGKARIRLAAQTQVKSWVTLGVTSPANLVFVSPWDERAQVPSFENDSQNYVSVVLAERADRRLLEDPAALRAMVQRANQVGVPRAAERDKSDGEQRKRALEEVAKIFGLEPQELDNAIRAWGQKASDPYDRGLAELYTRNYAEATPDLRKSAAIRREKASQAEAELVDADLSLGESLNGEGKYREATEPLTEANLHRRDDPVILSWLGSSLQSSGDYAGAEPSYRRALSLDEKALGPDHPDVARDLNNLATLMHARGDYAGAEPL